MGEIAQLEELLKHMLQPNTDVVRQATQTLNKILKQATSIPLLLELTFKSTHAEVYTNCQPSIYAIRFDRSPLYSLARRLLDTGVNYQKMSTKIRRKLSYTRY
jgi:hypothetical protein